MSCVSWGMVHATRGCIPIIPNPACAHGKHASPSVEPFPPTPGLLSVLSLLTSNVSQLLLLPSSVPCLPPPHTTHHTHVAQIRALSGYVLQDDVLPGTSSVFEYLAFNALLRLPPHRCACGGVREREGGRLGWEGADC